MKPSRRKMQTIRVDGRLIPVAAYDILPAERVHEVRRLIRSGLNQKVDRLPVRRRRT